MIKSTDWTSEDKYWMTQAIHLAERGFWSTMPNPRVGCVIVNNNQLVGQGWHKRAGSNHAEINALLDAGYQTDHNQCEGAHVYVTLEPCSHQGKTPPCVHALIEAGVSKVVAAMSDPNPAVSGKGFDALRNAGILVKSGLLKKQAYALNPGFFRRIAGGNPWVRCKMAMSLDGRTAMANGESKWITGVEARRDVQQWRARSCAILTGLGCVLTDDPLLNVREKELPLEDQQLASDTQPARIVLDSHLKISEDARLFKIQTSVHILTTSRANKTKIEFLMTKPGVEVVELPADFEGRVQWASIMTWLRNHQFNEVMIESGAKVAGSGLAAGIVDELLIYIAPKLMGSLARPLFDLPLNKMSEALNLDVIEQYQLGKDIMIRALVSR